MVHLPAKLSASFICSDLYTLKQSLAEMHTAQIDYLHFDIMDGHFVPRLGSGTYFLRQLTQRQPIPVEVHLMIEHPLTFIDEVAEVGPSMITFHIETTEDAYHILRRINSHGIKAGIALRPFTPLNSIEPLLDHLDSVLLMAFSPGVLNQPMLPGFTQRVVDCRELLDRRGRQTVDICVDGGINLENIRQLHMAGVSIFVLGNSGLFLDGVSIPVQVTRLRQALAGE